MSSDVKINGMDDLLKALERFPARFQKNVVKGAVRAGASGISKEAKKNVHVKYGALKKSIGLTQRKTRSKTMIGFAISPRKDILVKALVEQGLIKKWSVSKNTGFRSSNYDNYGGYVEVGNSHMPAYPYLRPAYENMGPESIRLAREYMAKRMDKEIAKAKR